MRLIVAGLRRPIVAALAFCIGLAACNETETVDGAPSSDVADAKLADDLGQVDPDDVGDGAGLDVPDTLDVSDVGDLAELDVLEPVEVADIGPDSGPDTQADAFVDTDTAPDAGRDCVDRASVLLSSVKAECRHSSHFAAHSLNSFPTRDSTAAASGYVGC
ncbi:MAG: hypothetical protein ACI9OJ_003103 [Myxococcota bacterium]|jgi:hypothetical protein